MNEQSSRSHAIFSITVERSDTGADKQQHVRAGKLHMVDLAVSIPLSNIQRRHLSQYSCFSLVSAKSVIRSYRKSLEPGLKLKIQPLAEFCPPSVWHKICWYLWTIWKSVFQTNDTKELKTQGVECQGPEYTIVHLNSLEQWLQHFLKTHSGRYASSLFIGAQVYTSLPYLCMHFQVGAEKFHTEFTVSVKPNEL